MKASSQSLELGPGQSPISYSGPLAAWSLHSDLSETLFLSIFHHHGTSDTCILPWFCRLCFARTPSCWRSNTHGWLSPFRTTTWSIGEIWIQTRSCIAQKYHLCNILFVAQPFGFGEFSTSEIMPRNYIVFKDVQSVRALAISYACYDCKCHRLRRQAPLRKCLWQRLQGPRSPCKTAEPRAVLEQLWEHHFWFTQCWSHKHAM